MKKFIALLMAAMMLLSATSALACTGVYVGKDVSANGTYMITHTCDSSNTDQSCARVMPHIEEADRTYNPYAAFGINTVAFPLPEVTYAYNSNPVTMGLLENSVINEMGVAVTGAVTTYVTDEALAADPCTSFMEGGLSEMFLCGLVGMCAATAREGIQVLADYIDMYGNSEQNAILICDQNEAWYIEYYTGHQWCAVKCPDDCVAVWGNEPMLHVVDPSSEDVICSEGLFSLPKENGFAVYNENGEMDLYETYAGGMATMADYSNRRTWYGHYMLAPSTAGEYETKKYYDLFYQPDDIVTLNDVFEVTRARFEGTEFCPEENPEVDGMRVIGVERQTSTGICEIYPNLPADMCGVNWTCLSGAEMSVYLPISNLATAVHPAYSYLEGNGGQDTNMAHYCFKRLAALAEANRSRYGAGVRDYWANMEYKIVDEYNDVLAETLKLYETDKAAAAEYITNYTIEVQAKAYEDANVMFDELLWFMIQYTNTQLSAAEIPNYVPSLAK